jgi:hypothetical protein
LLFQRFEPERKIHRSQEYIYQRWALLSFF